MQNIAGILCKRLVLIRIIFVTLILEQKNAKRSESKCNNKSVIFLCETVSVVLTAKFCKTVKDLIPERKYRALSKNRTDFESR